MNIKMKLYSAIVLTMMCLFFGLVITGHIGDSFAILFANLGVESGAADLLNKVAFCLSFGFAGHFYSMSLKTARSE